MPGQSRWEIYRGIGLMICCLIKGSGQGNEGRKKGNT
jgi:hypothetical protein